jgi:hypothetical protein
MAVLLNLRADFPHFGLKIVEHSRYLPVSSAHSRNLREAAREAISLYYKTRS